MGQPPSKAPYHHGNLRETLLAEALAAIQREGLEKLSLRALARSIGVSQTAMYRHFANRNDLLAAIAGEGFDELSARLLACIEKNAGDTLDQLRQTGRVYVAFGVENRARYLLMFSKSIVDHCNQEELATKGDTAFGHLVGIIARGVDEGLLKPLPPQIMATSFWALVHGYVSLIFESNLNEAFSAGELDLVIASGTEALVAGFQRLDERS